MGALCGAYPSAVRVRSRSTGLDFRLYEFRLGRKLILTAYLGDRPDIEHLRRRRAKKVGLDRNVFMASYVRAERGLVERESVVDVGERAETRFLHLWYSDLEPKDAGVADQIIDSLHLCLVKAA